MSWERGAPFPPTVSSSPQAESPPPRTRPAPGKGDHLGRSPGSRVWVRAGLPGDDPSGMFHRHSPLTVAGAAADLHRVPFSSDITAGTEGTPCIVRLDLLSMESFCACRVWRAGCRLWALGCTRGGGHLRKLMLYLENTVLSMCSKPCSILCSKVYARFERAVRGVLTLGSAEIAARGGKRRRRGGSGLDPCILPGPA